MPETVSLTFFETALAFTKLFWSSMDCSDPLLQAQLQERARQVQRDLEQNYPPDWVQFVFEKTGGQFLD